MAAHSNVRIRRDDVVGTKIVDVPVASATVFAPGDLVDLSGSTLVAHTGDNSYFLGVALEGSPTGDISPISVARECVIRIKLVSGSADATIGKAVKYSAGANGTDWQVTVATAEGIMYRTGNFSNFAIIKL